MRLLVSFIRKLVTYFEIYSGILLEKTHDRIAGVWADTDASGIQNSFICFTVTFSEPSVVNHFYQQLSQGFIYAAYQAGKMSNSVKMCTKLFD